ncbi:MAG: hypothetical protein ACK5MN_04340 [Lachnospiraceae bacterium]
MKIVRKAMGYLLSIMLLGGLLLTNAGLLESEAGELSVGTTETTYIDDVPSASTNQLGIAQNFLVFADSVKLYSHTNGNIAVNSLSSTSNFGLNVKNGGLALAKEYNYAKTIDSIMSSSFISERENKFVIGNTVTCYLQIMDNAMRLKVTKWITCRWAVCIMKQNLRII